MGVTVPENRLELTADFRSIFGLSLQQGMQGENIHESILLYESLALIDSSLFRAKMIGLSRPLTLQAELTSHAAHYLALQLWQNADPKKRGSMPKHPLAEMLGLESEKKDQLLAEKQNLSFKEAMDVYAFERADGDEETAGMNAMSTSGEKPYTILTFED